MRTILTILALYIIIGAAVDAGAETRCDISAAINNQDSSATTDAGGTNVRKGPGTNFPVVRTLVNPTGFIFHITASSGSWMHIDTFNAIDGTGKSRALDGWIYAPSLFLKFDTGDKGKPYGKLFSEPSASSKPVLTSAQMDKKEGRIASLISCQGTWAKVLWEGSIGWLAKGDQCTDMWDICGEA